LSLVPNDRVQRQFRRVAETVLREFPADVGGTVLFTGVGSGAHVADIAAQVAIRLVQQPDTVVTLIDADGAAQHLTERLACRGQAGLAELLQAEATVASTILATDVDNLHFIAFGDRRLTRNPIASGAVNPVLSKLRQDCRYIVLAAGIETTPLQAMLGRCSDGTYLVVQLGAAPREDTTALASFLSRAGARLLGSIATSAS
jgi:Mrp family chromosome partitioning ATPase